MNAIRAELERIGPDAVRRAMVAFEHRANQRGCTLGSSCCCFLTHAYPGQSLQCVRLLVSNSFLGVTAVEAAFEGWTVGRSPLTGRQVLVTKADPIAALVSRESLRLECVAYLAEHGMVPEPAAPVAVA